jgi:pimeloyl-ACP methyl ester carboxylesterase
MYHGISNTPYQFKKLGLFFHKNGFNVFIPRMPYHGYKDKLTKDLGKLTSLDIENFSKETFQLAEGLGDQVYIMGLSAGGVVGTWIGQKYPAKKIIIIAPAMSVPTLPDVLQKATISLGKKMSGVHFWWVKPLSLSASPQAHPLPKGNRAYPRVSLGALSQFWGMGLEIIKTVDKFHTAVDSFILVTNENDVTTSKFVINLISKTWNGSKKMKFKHFVFGKNLKLPHDLIDPTEPGGNIKYVYPILYELTVKD